MCTILTAGLWPFHRPQNQVSWLQDRDGLGFGHHAVVMSSRALNTARSSGDLACAIEIWLQLSSIHNHRTILTFYTRDNPRQFSLSMWEKGLLLRSQVRNEPNVKTVSEAFVADVFQEGRPVFLSVTSDGRKSQVYVNGVSVSPNRDFAFSAGQLTGQLVIGPSPESSDGWNGRLLGLSVYRRILTSSEVLHDYENWTAGTVAQLENSGDIVAAYRFNERSGTIAHNLVSQESNLSIPSRFVLRDQPMLQSPWSEFRNTWGYWRDVVINVAGFVPLGFFFSAYLSERVRPAPMLTVLLVGAALSLIIEVLQAYLPTRDSGITDILTNTLGTSAGMVLYRAWRSSSLSCKSSGIGRRLPAEGMA